MRLEPPTEGFMPREWPGDSRRFLPCWRTARCTSRGSRYSGRTSANRTAPRFSKRRAGNHARNCRSWYLGLRRGWISRTMSSAFLTRQSTRQAALPAWPPHRKTLHRIPVLHGTGWSTFHLSASISASPAAKSLGRNWSDYVNCFGISIHPGAWKNCWKRRLISTCSGRTPIERQRRAIARLRRPTQRKPRRFKKLRGPRRPHLAGFRTGSKRRFGRETAGDARSSAAMERGAANGRAWSSIISSHGPWAADRMTPGTSGFSVGGTTRYRPGRPSGTRRQGSAATYQARKRLRSLIRRQASHPPETDSVRGPAPYDLGLYRS